MSRLLFVLFFVVTVPLAGLFFVLWQKTGQALAAVLGFLSVGVLLWAFREYRISKASEEGFRP